MKYADLYKQYNDYFGEVVAKAVEEERKWKRAEILNKMDMALATGDKVWFIQLRAELEGWK